MRCRPWSGAKFYPGTVRREAASHCRLSAARAAWHTDAFYGSWISPGAAFTAYGPLELELLGEPQPWRTHFRAVFGMTGQLGKDGLTIYPAVFWGTYLSRCLAQFLQRDRPPRRLSHELEHLLLPAMPLMETQAKECFLTGWSPADGQVLRV